MVQRGLILMDDPWQPCLGKMSPVTIMGQECVIRRLLITSDCGEHCWVGSHGYRGLGYCIFKVWKWHASTTQHALECVAACMLRKWYCQGDGLNFVLAMHRSVMPGKLRGSQLALEISCRYTRGKKKQDGREKWWREWEKGGRRDEGRQ